MLTEEDGLWFPIDKPNSRVFPIANVVTEAHARDGVAEVEGVEVEVECVNDATGFRYPDYDARGGGQAQAGVAGGDGFIVITAEPLGGI